MEYNDSFFLNVPKFKNGIPKLLVQIYIDFSLKKPLDNEKQVIPPQKLPSMWKEGKESVKSFCNKYDWTYFCIDNNVMNEFIKTFYPECWETFWSLPFSIERVDILKYLWLHRYGGIYMDMDFVIANEFDTFLEDLKAPLMVLSSSNMENVITNSFIVSVPKLDMFYRLSQKALIEDVPFWAISTHLQVMLCTGPLAFTSAIQNENIPFLILPHELFFPNNPLLDDKTEKEYKEYLQTIKKSKKGFLLPIKGGSWNSWDTQILNMFNKYRILVIVISSFFFLFQTLKLFFQMNNKQTLGILSCLVVTVCSVAYIGKS
jgi:mannosyltransferase OCH1-like enzyme